MNADIDCHRLADVGKVRAVNEDHFLIGELGKSFQVQKTSLSLEQQAGLVGHSQGRLLVVADGMGGHAAGRRASSLCEGQVSLMESIEQPSPRGGGESYRPLGEPETAPAGGQTVDANQ
jgi:serine/threonine protein phosphatase PrpC